MIGIKIKGQNLDLYENTTLSIEMNSTLYFGEDVDVMPGSFAFPFQVPLSPKNNELLNYPHTYDNSDFFAQNESCEVYFEENLLLKGFLSVKEATNHKAKIEIIFNPFKGIKDMPLNELDMGRFNFPTDQQAAWDFMTDTAYNPDNHIFVYVPTVNKWLEQNGYIYEPSHPDIRNRFQFLNFGLGGNKPTATFGILDIITPYLKLSYIVKKIFENIKMDAALDFFENKELDNLLLYSEFDINTPSLLPKNFDLKNLVTSTPVGTWLKVVFRRFNCGFFYDTLFSSVSIKSFNQVLTQSEIINFTEKASSEYAINRKITGLKKIKNTPNKLRKFDPTKITTVSVTNYNQIPTNSTHIYTIGQESYLGIVNSNTKKITASTDLSNEILIDLKANKEYESAIETADTYYLRFGNGLLQEHWLGIDFFNDNKKNIIIPYRGVMKYGNSEFPSADPNLIRPDGKPVRIGNENGTILPQLAKISHRWEGDNGLYATFWQKAIELINSTKEQKIKILLSVEDFINFRFDKRIMIHNQLFLVKKINLQLTNKGISPCDFELINVT
jgi:hypothetical protein